MTLVQTASRSHPVRLHTKESTLADLRQLSAVAAFAVIGMSLSFMALTSTEGGEWLIAVMNGF